MEFYKKEGLPENHGLIESGFLARNHNKKHIIKHFNENHIIYFTKMV